MSIVGENIKRLREARNLTQEQLAAKSGVKRTSITTYETTEHQPSIETAKKLCRVFGISVEDLFTSDLAIKKIKVTEGQERHPKPIYNVEGTAGALVVFQQEKPEFIEGYIDIPQFQDCDFYIKVFGNSMYPKYCNGDLVACRELKDRNIIPYGEAYLIITQEHRMIKYIDGSKNGKELVLRSEHPDFKPFPLNRKDILFLYVIKGKITRNII